MVKKLILAAVLSVGYANAGMFDSVAGAVGMGGGTAAATVSADSLDATLKNYAAAQKLVLQSSMDLSKALESKEDSAKSEEELKAINGMTDPKEKEAALNKFMIDKQTAIAKAMESQSAVEKIKKADANTKKLVGSGLYNLALGGLKYTATLASAKSSVSALTSNPMEAAKYVSQFSALKDMVVSLPESIVILGTTTSQLVKLCQSAGVKVPAMPTTADAAPKASDK